MAYSIPSGTNYDAFANAEEVIISEGVTLSMSEKSPFARRLMLDTTSPMRANQYSQNWLINVPFIAGAEGVIQPDVTLESVFGPGVTEAGSMTRYRKLTDLTDFWPDAADSPSVRTKVLSIGIAGYKTNLSRDLGDAFIDATDRVKAELTAGQLSRAADQYSSAILHNWWADQNSNYELCKASNVTVLDSAGAAVAGTAVGTVLKFNTSNSAPHRFHRNQLVDFLYAFDPDGSGGSAAAQYDVVNKAGANRYIGLVREVKPVTNEVFIEFRLSGNPATVATLEAIGSGASAGGSVGSEGTNTLDIPEGSIVVPYGTRDAATNSSKSYGMHGPNSYMKTTGYLLGDDRVTTGPNSEGSISVTGGTSDSIPELASVIFNEGGAALTQELLTRRLQLVNEAFSHYMVDGQPGGIDIILTTEAVRMAYLNELRGRYMQLVGDAPLSLANEGTRSQFSFSHGDRNYAIETDPYIGSGELYGFKTRGSNWRFGVPPDIMGFQSEPSMPNQIPFRFVAQAGGLPSNVVPIYGTSGATNKFGGAVQMPGVIRGQLYCRDPRGLKLTNLSEDKEYIS